MFIIHFFIALLKSGEPYTGLNLNHWLFLIWQYFCGSTYSVTKFSSLY